MRVLGPTTCGTVLQDNFYVDQSAKFDHDGGAVNFDHPDSIDFALLKNCLGALKNGMAVDIPRYDFTTHKRLKQTVQVQPKPVIIVDGILILHIGDVRGLFHETIFFETPEDVRFNRRLARDVNERGRTHEGVVSQFKNQVKPMHDQFVEPSKIHATTIVKETGKFDVWLADFVAKLKKKI